MRISWCKALILANLLAQSLSMAAVSREPVLAAHFVLAPSSPAAAAVPLEDALMILDIACDAGFNVIVVQLANGIKLESAPQLIRKGAWDKQELVEFIRQATECGIEVVPEIKLLTHQEKFFQGHFPDLMYNAVTYDPRDDAVYEMVNAVLDEIVGVMRPRAVSIGHDEVVGWNEAHARKHLADGETMLPAQLFLQDVLRLHRHLVDLKVEVWMWGDMLIAPDEAPRMVASYLHGSAPGYGQAVRDQLPKDIVICDWHYVDQRADFSSLAIFQSEGFRVIGTTWRNSETTRLFSQFAADNDAYGMMATIWFYVPLRKWSTAEEILRVSAEYYGAAFSEN